MGQRPIFNEYTMSSIVFTVLVKTFSDQCNTPENITDLRLI
jgi:hypothetical protein